MIQPILLYIFLAGLPSLVLLIVIYKLDSLKPEPKGTIVKIFILGCVSIIPAFLIELGVSTIENAVLPLYRNLFSAFVVAGMVEEGVKLFIVKRWAFPRPEFDEVMDGIVYTVTASLGFAFWENILYGLNGDFFQVFLLRAVTAVPLHATCSGIMGYFIGKSKFKEGSALFGYILAVAIHGLYDFILFSPSISWWLIIPLLILSIVILALLIKRAKNRDKKYISPPPIIPKDNFKN